MLCDGAWEAYVAERGGRRIIALPASKASLARKLSDVTQASVTVPAANCAGLDAIVPWEHELVLERDGIERWAGPIQRPSYNKDGVAITAKDVFAWMDRRRLEQPFDVTDDLAYIFDFVVSQALMRDTSPGITVAAEAVGVVGRRVNLNGLQRAGDLLRELARTAVPFSVIGHEIRTGDLSGPRRVLTTDSFGDDLTIDPDGQDFATEVTLYGRTSDLVATAGGVSMTAGLVQRVDQEPTISDLSSLGVAAENRLETFLALPTTVRGSLTARADLTWDDLVPGRTFDVRVETPAKSVYAEMLLTDVSASIDEHSEKVTITLQGSS